MLYFGLFDTVVIGWMGVPIDVAEWVRPGMQIMVLSRILRPFRGTHVYIIKQDLSGL